MRSVFLFFLLCACLTAGCAPPRVDARGHADLQRKAERIASGLSKDEVLGLLGSPSTTSSFGPEAWYYVAARKESVAFLKPKIKEQSVLRILFDEEGRVAEVKTYGLKDSAKFSVAEEMTPTEGQKLGLWEQMLGNLGRFNRDEDSRAASPSSRTGRP